MYDDGFGNIYHPTCAAISCRDIPRDLEYCNRKWVHHNNQGKKIGRHGDCLKLRRDFEIEGKRILKPRVAIPNENLKKRRNPLPRVTNVIHEECLPSFPAWKNQIADLIEKVGKISENQLKELAELWKEWSRESAKSYLRNQELRISSNFIPPWKNIISNSTTKIRDKLKLNNKITCMFFEKFRDRCLIDCAFLLSDTGRTVCELEKQLGDFVHETKRTLNFEWPMAVAHVMLDEGSSWIPLLVNSKSHEVFNAVAATMARLLYDLIIENISRIRAFFDSNDRAKLIIVLNEGDEVFDYWQRISVILELAKIPRVDHKIYPELFTEAWIDVRGWFDSHSILFDPLPQPLTSINFRIFELEHEIEKYQEDPEDVGFWRKIVENVLEIRQEILLQETRIVQGFIIYDSRAIKARALKRIGEIEERVKSIILSCLAHKNNGIRADFSLCSSKLFRNNVMLQLRNIEEVQNELPKIKGKIKSVHIAYSEFMNYFVMPDYDLRQYYEISRLGAKLEQLINFVWERIHQERQWITKQVSEKTSKNYYECEMIEKEWLDCLKKYRNAVRINEVQKVQIKMNNMAERSVLLRERDEKLIGQRSLLGLPASPIDCVRIAKLCQFFAKLTNLHYQTLLHRESVLRMRISEVDHIALVTETDRLKIDKDLMRTEAEVLNEHVTTSNEALAKIQKILDGFEKLLPVLGAISCQAMKDRHWKQILQDSDESVKVEENPLVSELLEMNFIEKAEQFEQVGAQAEKERVLEKSIENMREQWKSATFQTHHTGELLTTELNVQMQTHLARSQTILSSPFAFSILDHIKYWLNTLLILNTFVDLYKQCDVRWRKIEGVFSTEDIAYQMPNEFRTFKKISLKWLHINNQITEDLPIIEQMDLVKTLNSELEELEILFGKMESGFHAYLRKKRAIFPRLFALSDELMLSLICDSREPANCKQYIPLLFPSLIKFEQNSKMEIVSVSTRLETLKLVKPVNVNISKRHVEKWMHDLDIQIKYTIKTQIRLLIEQMCLKLSPIDTLLSHPLQISMVYLKIAITHQIEHALKNNSLPVSCASRDALRFQECGFIQILLSELKSLVRKCQHCWIHESQGKEKLQSIYNILNNTTHLVNSFISDHVIFLDDYRWISQLRYYFHIDNVFIRVGTISASYDYEFHDVSATYDSNLLEHSLAMMLYANHFGFGVNLTQNDSRLLKELAFALGRPYFECNSGNEEEFRMLIDGALLLGGVLHIQDSELAKHVERDVYTAHRVNNSKYHFEMEITINSSFMILLNNSFKTGRQIFFPNFLYNRILDETCSLRGISVRERLSDKFAIIKCFENYTGYKHLWGNYLQSTLDGIIENHEATDSNLINHEIFHNFSLCMKKTERILMRELLLQSGCEKCEGNVSGLIRLLKYHQIVAICGDSHIQKRQIVAQAAAQQKVALSVKFGEWEELRRDSENIIEDKNTVSWILIDGSMDLKTIRWIESTMKMNTISPQQEMPIIKANDRIIINMERMEWENLATIVLDETREEICGVGGEFRDRIEEVFSYFTEIECDRNKIWRRIEIMRNAAQSDENEIFEYLLITSLLSFLPKQQLMGFSFKGNWNLENFFDKVLSRNDWRMYDDTKREICKEEFYIIHIIEFLLNTKLIPILICEPCREFTEFLNRLQDELDNQGWCTIALAIDKNTKLEEIKQFVENCAIMFGDNADSPDYQKQSDGSHFILIRGIENAQFQIIDWLRYRFESSSIMKIVLVSSKDVDFYPKRFQNFLFRISWIDITGQEILTHPAATYHSIISSISKDIKIKDIRDSIVNQLINALSEARILRIYEKVNTIKTSKDFRIVRGKGFADLGELISTYQRALDVKREQEKKLRFEKQSISLFDAKNINLIEKVTQVPFGNILIVGENYSKIYDYLGIIGDLKKMNIYSNRNLRSLEEWNDQIIGILRNCLLEAKETLLTIFLDSPQNNLHNQILIDLHSICCHKMVSPRYLTRILLSEFVEKHTLEGRGIWSEIENKLSNLRIVIVIKSEHFNWFHDQNKELLSMLILNWWGHQSKKELEVELVEELKKATIFSKIQIEQIIGVMNEVESMGYIKSNKPDMLKMIIKLASKKKERIKQVMTKYEKGMEKMRRAEDQVAGMQGELLRLQPQLVRTSIETSMLMSSIEKETIEVENAREVVAANENKANEAATKAQSLKAESEAELASAIPALDAAVDALETMTQNDVSSLKTMRFPPYAVRLCMEAVCILLGVKPVKVTNEHGEVRNDYWISGQKLLSDIHFLSRIRQFARDRTSKRTMKLIREQYLSKEEFDAEKVKQCSLAAEGLCRWVLAIDMYNQISKIVEPKRERLKKTEILVKQHMKQLEIKRKALLKVTEKLQGLSDQFSQMCQKKQELESQISSCELRMERAERLVEALGGEKDKWQEKITDIMHEDSLCVPHAVGATLALMVFARFPIHQREEEVRKIMAILFPSIEINIPCDLVALIHLVDHPILFTNDDERALSVLNEEFPKVVVSDTWNSKICSDLLINGSVLLFDVSMNNLGIVNEIISAEYFENGEDTIFLRISNVKYEVNSKFRLFLRSHTDVPLNNVIKINNQYSDMELNFEICHKMGLFNWAGILNSYNSMIKSRQNDVNQMEKTENEMLELLGRSRDLDDERAIDLLAEARNLQSAIVARNREIEEVVQLLRSIESKMCETVNWAAKIIRTCYSLRKFDAFYEFSFQSLIEVLGTKLFEKLETVDCKIVNLKISKLYWNFVQHSLEWEDKKLIHHLLFQNMNYKIEKLTINGKDLSDCDTYSHFVNFLLKTSCRSIILLKYDAQVYSSILNFEHVSKSVNWKVYSILDNLVEKLEKLTDEHCWLLINLNNCDYRNINQVKEIIRKIKNLPTIHPSFRTIIGYSDEIQGSDELISLSTNRLYFSGAPTLAQQIRRIFANNSMRSLFMKSDKSQQTQFIQIMAFHFALKLRQKFDEFFQVLVDDSDLFAVLKLYQQIRNLSEQPNLKLDAMKINKNLIQPIYFPKISNIIEKHVIEGMIQWILERNLQSPADNVLNKLLHEKIVDFDDFPEFTHDDTILCGLNPRICREIQNQSNRKILMKMRSLFEEEFSISRKAAKIFSTKSWLKQLESGLTKIDGREISNLTELTAFLTINFAIKYKIGIHEVLISAEILEEEQEILDDSQFLIISNCTLIGAQLHHSEIRECVSRENQKLNIIIKPGRKIPTSSDPQLPVICPTTRKAVTWIQITSQLPIIHWKLRGAHFTVGV